MDHSAEATISIKNNKAGSAKAQVLSARLRAVQAVYQCLMNGDDLRDIAAEYLSVRLDMVIEGEALVPPDQRLLKSILLGVNETWDDLETIVGMHLNPVNRSGEGGDADVEVSKRVLEPLLKAVLMCAAYEIAIQQDVDAPILVNDYLNVTHGFYEQGEASLVNAILDKIAKSSR